MLRACVAEKCTCGFVVYLWRTHIIKVLNFDCFHEKFLIISLKFSFLEYKCWWGRRSFSSKIQCSLFNSSCKEWVVPFPRWIHPYINYSNVLVLIPLVTWRVMWYVHTMSDWCFATYIDVQQGLCIAHILEWGLTKGGIVMPYVNRR